MEKTSYPYEQKGARQAPRDSDRRNYLKEDLHEGGLKEPPLPAQRFARRFAGNVTYYPRVRELPNWVLAMVERKAPVEVFVKTIHDRLLRAPTEENQELALVLANEIARMEGGSELLRKYVSHELLDRLTGRGAKR